MQAGKSAITVLLDCMFQICIEYLYGKAIRIYTDKLCNEMEVICKKYNSSILKVIQGLIEILLKYV